MAEISDLMRYASPETNIREREIWDFGAVRPGDRRRTEYRYNVGMDYGDGYGSPFGGRENPLDDILKGYDRESNALQGKLRSIYDGYTGSYEEMEGKVRPILDLIEGDIGKFEEYLGDYEGLLSGMQGDFLDSIIIDPNASRTRHEYMGNVAAQYDRAQDAMRRQAIQQGMNPYANRGAQREMALGRAGAMAGAANQAYSDWREAHNRDIRAQQEANAMYADLFSRQGGMYGDLLRARSGQIAGEAGLYDARMAADRAKASGYEGLLGLQEQRRNQAIQLGQAQAMQHAEARQALSDLQTKVPNQWFEGRNIATDFAPNYPSFG